jgi:formate-dependent nitrite reductase membrane component NrfD
VPHRVPWDWRVSLYTWTKGIAAGAYLVPAMLVLFGILAEDSALWRWFTPIVAGAFLAATGLVLIADLDHPERVTLLFTRPRWMSWLARGGVIISLFGLVLALHLAGSSLAAGFARLLVWPGVVLAALTAVYTAYLLAQARARDLWQNPLLVPQFLVQAAMAGAALLLVAAPWVAPDASAPLAVATAAAALVHLLLVAGETTLAHPTAHAALAARTMVAGRYAPVFWSGVVLMAAGLLAPWLGAAAAVPALAGLLAYEHAYVQAGQSVPLA